MCSGMEGIFPSSVTEEVTDSKAESESGGEGSGDSSGGFFPSGFSGESSEDSFWGKGAEDDVSDTEKNESNSRYEYDDTRSEEDFVDEDYESGDEDGGDGGSSGSAGGGYTREIPKYEDNEVWAEQDFIDEDYGNSVAEASPAADVEAINNEVISEDGGEGSSDSLRGTAWNEADFVDEDYGPTDSPPPPPPPDDFDDFSAAAIEVTRPPTEGTDGNIVDEFSAAAAEVTDNRAESEVVGDFSAAAEVTDREVISEDGGEGSSGSSGEVAWTEADFVDQDYGNSVAEASPAEPVTEPEPPEAPAVETPPEAPPAETVVEEPPVEVPPAEPVTEPEPPEAPAVETPPEAPPVEVPPPGELVAEAPNTEPVVELPPSQVDFNHIFKPDFERAGKRFTGLHFGSEYVDQVRSPLNDSGVYQAIVKAENPFDNKDYVKFSSMFPDNYTGKQIEEFIRYAEQNATVLPDGRKIGPSGQGFDIIIAGKTAYPRYVIDHTAFNASANSVTRKNK